MASVRFVRTSIIALIVLLYTSIAGAQTTYIDHRKHQVDSLEHALQTNPPEGIELIKTYEKLMFGYRETNTNKSVEYAHLLLSVTEGTEHVGYISYAYDGIGIGYYMQSMYDSAMIYYNKSLEAAELMEKYHYSEREIDFCFSTIYGQIANLNNIQGQYHEAISYYNKAMVIFEKYDRKESQSIAYYNIGEMFIAMANYEQAEVNFLKLEAIAHEIPDSFMIVSAKHGLSKVSLHNKNYDKALEEAGISYRYFFAHPEEGANKIEVLNLLSEIYLEGYNNPDKAEEYVHEAFQVEEVYDFEFERAVSLRILSQIHLYRGKWHEAKQSALEAISINEDEPKNVLLLYDVLIKAYAKIGDSDKVYEYFDKHNTLQTSFSNRNYQSAISEMEVRYDTEKKEIRITTLEDRQRIMVLLGAAGLAVLLLLLALFVSLWRWTSLKKRASEQKVKQLEQEKQLIATQALLDGEAAERTRLARDLHDGLGSMLTCVRLNLENIKKTKSDDFGGTITMLNDSMAELRRIAHHLMPESLSRNGLKTSLTDFFNELPAV